MLGFQGKKKTFWLKFYLNLLNSCIVVLFLLIMSIYHKLNLLLLQNLSSYPTRNEHIKTLMSSDLSSKITSVL